MSDFSKATIETGYQFRIIFLTYDGFGGYKVVKRTNNFTTEAMLTQELWETYDYMAFNVSTNPLTDIDQLIPEVSTKINLVPII